MNLIRTYGIFVVIIIIIIIILGFLRVYDVILSKFPGRLFTCHLIIIDRARD